MKNVVAIVILLSILVSCGRKKMAVDPDIYYTCSMDPQVVSDRPGKCPICKMELTPVKRSSVEQSDDLQLSDQQVRLGNIVVDTIGVKGIGEEISFPGTLNFNGEGTSAVSARASGRIDRLYVKNAGDLVKRGAPLYELYSEELNNAKQEYILAVQRRELFREQSVINFEDIIDAARNKLRLWGLTPAQIAALEKLQRAPLTTTFFSNETGYVTSVDVTEGSYVMEGSSLLKLADLSTLWVEAQIFPSQLSLLPADGIVKVLVTGTGDELNGRVSFINPELSPDSRVTLIRIAIPNKGNDLRPGMTATVRIKTRDRQTIVLPVDAVIRDSKGSTVWIQTEKNTYRSKMVSTGAENNGMIEITQGLNRGDKVVISGTYLLHSEFVFKRGTDPMESHSH